MKDTHLDWLLVIVTALTVALPFLGAFNKVNWLFFGVVYVVLSNLHLNGSMHYHIHRPMFKSGILNSLYEYLCSIPNLVSFEAYKFIHIEHHKYTNDRLVNGRVGDPVSTYRRGNGKEESFWKYVIYSSYRDNFFSSDLFPKKDTTDWAKFKVQNLLGIVALAAVILINPLFGICYIAAIFLSTVVNAALSFNEHHKAMDHEDPSKDSVSCYNKLYNFLFFNTGYHQEHHYRPGVHWTKLPDLTKQLPKNRRTVSWTLFNNVFTE